MLVVGDRHATAAKTHAVALDALPAIRLARDVTDGGQVQALVQYAAGGCGARRVPSNNAGAARHAASRRMTEDRPFNSRIRS